jgi:hypothetical protein
MGAVPHNFSEFLQLFGQRSYKLRLFG